MQHDIIVFLGPSLNLDKAKKIFPAAQYLPPVKCGDILEILKYQPKKIAIIDGYFENVAAVWHKEILFALSKNVKIYGASSMGALRAAELHDFGMIGVGKIFEDFYNGILEDDDEVTVLHRPPQSYYTPITDAMVNLRATFEKALNHQIIALSTATQLISIAKNVFYKKRTIDHIFSIYQEKYTLSGIKELQNWINKGNYIDQKKLDAIRLLETLKNNIENTYNNNFKMHCSALFQKLLDRCYCEPNNSTLYRYENNNTAIRYIRLLAYILKSCECLNLCDNKKINFSDVLDLMHQPWINDLSPQGFFYGLMLLFDPEFENELNSTLSLHTKYSKILSYSAFVIFKISQILQHQNIVLSDDQAKRYLRDLEEFLPEKINFNHISIEQLVTIYFILKDCINNSMDRFLSQNPTYSDQYYFDLAEKVFASI